MSYIGVVGDKVTYVHSVCFATKYGDMFIHKFEDNNKNIYIWKTSKRDMPYYGTILKLYGIIKEHNQYKDEEQTALTRCKIEVIKTKAEIDKELANKQMESLNKGDKILYMTYRNYKEHYSDCEAVKGSFRSRDCTIGVIVREGRLKNSGVRGKHFYGFEFRTFDNKRVCYRAVSEENARKTMLKDFPESQD